MSATYVVATILLVAEILHLFCYLVFTFDIGRNLGTASVSLTDWNPYWIPQGFLVFHLVNMVIVVYVWANYIAHTKKGKCAPRWLLAAFAIPVTGDYYVMFYRWYFMQSGPVAYVYHGINAYMAFALTHCAFFGYVALLICEYIGSNGKSGAANMDAPYLPTTNKPGIGRVSAVAGGKRSYE